MFDLVDTAFSYGRALRIVCLVLQEFSKVKESSCMKSEMQIRHFYFAVGHGADIVSVSIPKVKNTCNLYVTCDSPLINWPI